MKKLISILLTLAMLAVMIPTVAVSAANSGAWTDAGNYDLSWAESVKVSGTENATTVDGANYQVKGFTETKTFVLDSAADLAGLAVLVNSAKRSTDNAGTNAWFDKCVYYITADIDLGGKDWTPIGKSFDHRFGGEIIGSKGKTDGTGTQITIKNMTVDSKANDTNTPVGFVGIVTGGAIKNIKFDNASVKALRFRVGGVVGQANVAVIENVDYNGAVSVTDGNAANGWDIAAGIVGAAWGGLTVENCEFKGTVTNGAISGDVTAGIAGAIESNGVDTLIKNCVVVSESMNCGAGADKTATGHGGIVGTARHAITIDNCYAYANMTSQNPRVGGIIGSAWNGVIVQNSQFDGTITGGANYAGAVLGYSNASMAVTVIGCLSTGVVASGSANYANKDAFVWVGNGAVLTLSAAKNFSTMNVYYQAGNATAAPAFVTFDSIKGDAAKTALSKLDWTKWTARAGLTPVLTVAKELAPTVYGAADIGWFNANDTANDQKVATKEALLGLSRLVKACGTNVTTEATADASDLFGAYKIKVAKTLENDITADLFASDVITILKANLYTPGEGDDNTGSGNTGNDNTGDNTGDDTGANTENAGADTNNAATTDSASTTPTTDKKSDETKAAEEEGGCGSSIFGGMAVMMVAAGAAVMIGKKKED